MTDPNSGTPSKIGDWLRRPKRCLRVDAVACTRFSSPSVGDPTMPTGANFAGGADPRPAGVPSGSGTPPGTLGRDDSRPGRLKVCATTCQPEGPATSVWRIGTHRNLRFSWASVQVSTFMSHAQRRVASC